MSQEEKPAKNVHFLNASPRHQPPKDAESPISALLAALEQAPERDAPQIASPLLPPGTVINHFNFNGGSNQVSQGGVFVNDQAKPPVPAIDTINAAQKLQLRQLRDEIAKLSEKCGFPKHPATIMSSLNFKMGVKKYDQINVDDFPAARTYLTDLRRTFTERVDFHAKREELQTCVARILTEHGQRSNLTVSSFDDLQKAYDAFISDLL